MGYTRVIEALKLSLATPNAGTWKVSGIVQTNEYSKINYITVTTQTAAAADRITIRVEESPDRSKWFFITALPTITRATSYFKAINNYFPLGYSRIRYRIQGTAAALSHTVYIIGYSS